MLSCNIRYFHEHYKTWHHLIKINSVCPPRVALAARSFFTVKSIKLFVGCYSTLEYKEMYFVSWANVVKDETLACFLVPQILLRLPICFDAHNISRDSMPKKNLRDSAAQSIYIFVHFPFSSKMSVNMYMIFSPAINTSLLCTIHWCL